MATTATYPLSNSHFAELERVVGSALSDIERKHIAQILGWHRLTPHVIADTTPAAVRDLLRRAKKKKSIEELLAFNSALGEETYDRLLDARARQAPWAEVEALIDGLLTQDVPKLQGPEQRTLRLTVAYLSLVCKIRFGTMRTSDGRLETVRSPTKWEKQTCRAFVTRALEIAGISFPNPTKDPQRLDALIWPPEAL